jgi:hypothetical protein
MMDKSCKNCAVDKEIRDTLNDSEGDLDLTKELCSYCRDYSGWRPIKDK